MVDYTFSGINDLYYCTFVEQDGGVPQ
jgi:hypothetical protein